MGQASSGKEVEPANYFPKRQAANEGDNGILGQVRREIVSMAPSLLLVLTHLLTHTHSLTHSLTQYAVASWFVTNQVNKILGEMSGSTGTHSLTYSLTHLTTYSLTQLVNQKLD